MKKHILFIIIVFGLFTSYNQTFAVKKKVLYIGNADLTKDDNLTLRLEEKYELTSYAATATTGIDLASPSHPNYAKQYDALLVSESVGSSSWGNGILNLDVPVVNTKFLVSTTARWGLLSATGSKVDVTTLAEAVITMNEANASHTLSAGLTGDVNLVAEGTVSANNIYLNALIAPVSGITTIATLKGDATKIVVFGMEAGTALNCTNTTFPLAATTKRVANIGFHVSCLNNLTESAYKLVEAALEWVTTPPTTGLKRTENMQNLIERKNGNVFVLNSQINPTSVLVYNMAGEVVKSISKAQNELDLSGLSNGIYAIRINSDNIQNTQKVVVY